MATVIPEDHELLVIGELEVVFEGATIGTTFEAPFEGIGIAALGEPTALLGIDLAALVATFGPLVSLSWTVSFEPLVIPLPGAGLLLASALAFLALRRRR